MHVGAVNNTQPINHRGGVRISRETIIATNNRCIKRHKFREFIPKRKKLDLSPDGIRQMVSDHIDMLKLQPKIKALVASMK